jgi:pimeloyl-ACP methyl ester carboxylesterase
MKRLHALVLVFVASVLAACASPQARLVGEDSVSELHAFKVLTAGFPNHTALVPTTDPSGVPVRIAVHKIGDGAHEHTLVMLHGVFADHSTWRFVQGALAHDNDLLVIDLPGCGDSDKPDPEKVADVVYTPQAVARRVLQAVRLTLNDDRRASKLALVGHSYGGLVAIRMFADPSIRAEYADVLDRVDRMVLFSPVDAAVHRPDPMFQQIAETSSFEVTAGLALGILQDVVADATLASASGAAPALREEYDKRLAVLRDPGSRRALQALVSRAINWRHDGSRYRPDWPAMEAVTAGYAHVTIPTMILWGTHDESLPISMGYKLAAELPNAFIHPVPGAMHSIQIERPGLAACLITDFVRTGLKPPPEAPQSADTPADKPAG